MKRIFACLFVGFLVQACAAGGQSVTELYPVRSGNSWGFIDAKGNVKIPFTYQAVRDFSEGVAAVQIQGKWGVIDESGQFVIPPKYNDWGADFQEGIAVASLRAPEQGKPDITWVYINRNGEVLLDTHLPVIGESVAYKVGSHYGGRAFLAYFDTAAVLYPYTLIDANCTELSRTKALDVRRFGEAKAAILIDTAFGFINTEGKVTIPPKFSDALYFSEGLAPVAVGGFLLPYKDYRILGNANWGYIDSSGNYVIQPQYAEAGVFQQGIAYVRVGRKYEPQSYRLLEYGKCGYINAQGKEVISPQFDQATDFVGNLAVVAIGKKAGVINRKGQYVLPLMDAFIFDIKLYPTGMIQVMTGENYLTPLYYDANGNLIWSGTKEE